MRGAEAPSIMELDAGTRRAVESAVDRANAADHSEDTLEDHKSRVSLPVRTQMLPELLEALQQGSAKLALSPELESMLNEAKRDGLALGGDGELEAAGRPWQR